jgi:hypothetical protein
VIEQTAGVPAHVQQGSIWQSALHPSPSAAGVIARLAGLDDAIATVARPVDR